MVSVGWSEYESRLALGVTAAVVGGVSGALLVYSRRYSIARRLLVWRARRLLETADTRIRVINSSRDWNKFLPQLLSEAQREGAVGLDCEWCNRGGKARPVAVLQLATVSGLCLLLRLPLLHPDIPQSLKLLLEDKSILKVGVATVEDSLRLTADYSLKVCGSLDLRYLAYGIEERRREAEENQREIEEKQYGKEDEPARRNNVLRLGLNALSTQYLGRSLDKSFRVSASNWEAERLNRRQVKYAAEDALAGAHLLVALGVQLLEDSISNGQSSLLPLPPLLPFLLPSSSLWRPHLASVLRSFCLPYLDAHFRYPKKGEPPSGQSSIAALRLERMSSMGGGGEGGSKASSRKHPTLQRPLYNNCWLEAPNGTRLCTCDTKKAKWYVSRGLGQEVCTDPLVVRLNFEPSGRPGSGPGDHQYYQQVRDNACVVCGTDKELARKSIVPHEYRCHFPALLKNHSSHDLVLLCPGCHHFSALADNALHRTLEHECSLPGPASKPRVKVDRELKKVKNAAGALLRSRAQLPEDRVKQLEEVVRSHFGTVTAETIQAGSELFVQVVNEDHVPHGLIVVQYYERNSGLLALLQRWRLHFLATSRPRHLPPHWSPLHGLASLTAAASALPPQHLDTQIYAAILTGTQATLTHHLSTPANPQTDEDDITTNPETHNTCTINH